MCSRCNNEVTIHQCMKQIAVHVENPAVQPPTAMPASHMSLSLEWFTGTHSVELSTDFVEGIYPACARRGGHEGARVAVVQEVPGPVLPCTLLADVRGRPTVQRAGIYTQVHMIRPTVQRAGIYTQVHMIRPTVQRARIYTQVHMIRPTVQRAGIYTQVHIIRPTVQRAGIYT